MRLQLRSTLPYHILGSAETPAEQFVEYVYHKEMADRSAAMVPGRWTTAQRVRLEIKDVLAKKLGVKFTGNYHPECLHKKLSRKRGEDSSVCDLCSWSDRRYSLYVYSYMAALFTNPTQELEDKLDAAHMAKVPDILAVDDPGTAELKTMGDSRIMDHMLTYAGSLHCEKSLSDMLVADTSMWTSVVLGQYEPSQEARERAMFLLQKVFDQLENDIPADQEAEKQKELNRSRKVVGAISGLRLIVVPTDPETLRKWEAEAEAWLKVPASSEKDLLDWALWSV